jgi:hypothetical protein
MEAYPFPTPDGWDYLEVAREAVPVWAAVSQIMESEPYLFRESAGGTYNCRETSDGRWSLHAYGVALDLNPRANPQRRPLTYDYPHTFLERMRGIRASGKPAIAWGGDWQTVAPDAMHWQVDQSPATCTGTITWDKGDEVPDTGPNGEPNWSEVSTWARNAWTKAHKAGILTEDSHPKDDLEVEQLMVYLARAKVI